VSPQDPQRLVVILQDIHGGEAADIVVNPQAPTAIEQHPISITFTIGIFAVEDLRQMLLIMQR